MMSEWGLPIEPFGAAGECKTTTKGGVMKKIDEKVWGELADFADTLKEEAERHSVPVDEAITDADDYPEFDADEGVNFTTGVLVGAAMVLDQYEDADQLFQALLSKEPLGPDLSDPLHKGAAFHAPNRPDGRSNGLAVVQFADDKKVVAEFIQDGQVLTFPRDEFLANYESAGITMTGRGDAIEHAALPVTVGALKKALSEYPDNWEVGGHYFKSPKKGEPSEDLGIADLFPMTDADDIEDGKPGFVCLALAWSYDDVGGPDSVCQFDPRFAEAGVHDTETLVLSGWLDPEAN